MCRYSSLSALSGTAIFVFQRLGVSCLLKFTYFAPNNVENKYMSGATAQKMDENVVLCCAWNFVRSCRLARLASGPLVSNEMFMVIGLMRCKRIISRF